MSDERRTFGRGNDRARNVPAPYDQRPRSPRPDYSGEQQLPPRHSMSTIIQHNIPPQGSTPAQIPGNALIPAVAGPSSASVHHQRSIGGDSGIPSCSRSGGLASSQLHKDIRNRPINPELLVTRPLSCMSKKGSEGTPIQLQANYFKLVASTDWRLYKYNVDFTPNEERVGIRKGLLRENKQTIGGYIFDGTIMYTSHRLPQPFTVHSRRKSDDAVIELTIRFVGNLVKGDEHYLQFYNIVMRKCQEYLQLQLVGRNFYDARNKVEIRQYKLELWPGYVTSIRQYENDILMCSEITYKVMRQQTLLDILHDCHREHGHNFQTRFSSQVIGLTVLTDYNNRTYRIDDVNFNVTPLSTFTCKEVKVTYKDYYLKKYQINIRDLRQPLLMTRSKNRERRAGLEEMIYLVPELCRSTGLTDEMRGDHVMMRELSNHTLINPNRRIERLLSFNRRLQSEPSVVNEFRDWNLRLDNWLIDIPARKLDAEDIYFHNRTRVSAGNQADWTREVKNKRMLISVQLQDWFMIVPNSLMHDARNFIDTIRSSVEDMQFQIAEPKIHPLSDDHAHSYPAAIEEIMSRNNPQMILCVVPNNRADRYAAIKKKCCVDRPVPSQCILRKNLNGKGVASIATKVAVQMNCKLGGTPWTVHIYSTSLMVVGFDVCHDSNKSCSYGALVASLDQTYGRYFSAINAHRSDEELSNHLATNIEKALMKYKHFNKKLPAQIVFYRDGVGDGQLHYVVEHEVQNLRRTLLKLYGSEDEVKLAYIIVTKRLNTRLFYNRNNPPPGTVVEDVITNPLKFDFYIISQSVRQGSVSPTAYNVIHNTTRYEAPILQKLSYKLTHIYFNWSGTVRVPAPCQFAHKLAFLVSQSIHATPSPHLEDILYYL